MEKNNRPIQDMPQIDGLRTIAVFAAMCSHYLPIGIGKYFAYGHAGVQLFFTISGFLITGILLKCRSAIDDGGSSGFYLKQFYARRFLRIFPLYYFVLATQAYIHRLGESLPYHLTYTSNIYMAAIGKIVAACHFWSLCVEEQFYLFWPFLLFFVPKESLGRWVLGLIPLSILFRAYCLASGLSDQTIYLLPANFDCLAAGALLAIAFAEKREAAKLAAYTRAAGVAGSVLLALLIALSILFQERHGIGQAASFLLLDTAIALISVAVVWKAAQGYSGPVGAFLNLAPVRYLGRISYGLYVIHLFTPLVTRDLLTRTGIHLSPGNTIAVNVLLTVVMAAASWHLFEAPINRLKRFFPYRQPAGAARGFEAQKAAAS
ncbi:acyltransferase [Geomonas sp. Red276]